MHAMTLKLVDEQGAVLRTWETTAGLPAIGDHVTVQVRPRPVKARNWRGPHLVELVCGDEVDPRAWPQSGSGAVRGLQTAFFEALGAELAGAGYVMIQQASLSNAGTIEIVRRGGLAPVLLAFTYHFQTGHNVFESKAPAWPAGRSNPNMFIARTTDDLPTVMAGIIRYLASPQRKSR